MASGTISLGTSGNLLGQISWSSTANTSANTSSVTATLYVKKSSATTEPTSGTWTGQLKVGGSTKTISTSKSVGQSWTSLGSLSVTVSHNADGTGTCSISGKATGPSGTSLGNNTVSGSKTVTLDTIPRYASVTQTVSSMTETTMAIKWTSDSTVDYIWYSTNNGSRWTGINVADGKTGTYTISSLTANTTYHVKTRVRNKQSQLTTDSAALSVTTYNYPYATTMPNFTIGENPTIRFYNPLERVFTMRLYGNGVFIDEWEGNAGTSMSGFANPDVVEALYNSIPNASSATYQIRCVYGGQTQSRNGGTYKVNTSVCKPTISTFTYQDGRATVWAITGDRSKIVQNQSYVHYNATGVTANNGASVSTVKVTVNGGTVNLQASQSEEGGWYGGGTTSTSAINSSSNVTAKLIVTDSRGVTASKNLTIQMVPWQKPTAIITLARQNNYYTETDITADADYTVIGTNAVTIQYRTRKKGASSYGSWANLQDNVTATFNADNAYAWDVQVRVYDSIGGSYTEGSVYNLSLSKGMPIIFFDRLKSSVGVNCFPADAESFEVSGINLLKELFFWSGDTITMSQLVEAGFISSSSTMLYFDVTMPKRMQNLTPTITGCTITCRNVAGSTFMNQVDVTGSVYTLALSKRADSNTIRVDVKINSGTFSATNNSPISVYVNSISFSFA